MPDKPTEFRVSDREEMETLNDAIEGWQSLVESEIALWESDGDDAGALSGDVRRLTDMMARLKIVMENVDA